MDTHILVFHIESAGCTEHTDYAANPAYQQLAGGLGWNVHVGLWGEDFAKQPKAYRSVGCLTLNYALLVKLIGAGIHDETPVGTWDGAALYATGAVEPTVIAYLQFPRRNARERFVQTRNKQIWNWLHKAEFEMSMADFETAHM